MPSVTVPMEFFVKERKTLYSYFEFAFFRELLQNAVDAGSENISFQIEDLQDTDASCLRVTCCDDGCGMDLDTLQNVFFCLGATTKSSGASIGGFGRARLLLCFSMNRYEIRTRDCHVVGRGGDYSLSHGLSHVRGSSFIIDVPATDTTLERLRSALEEVLQFSRTKARIFVEKEEHPKGVMSGRLVKRLSASDIGEFADVCASKSGDYLGKLIVRAGGVAMFTKDVRARQRVVVNLFDEKARVALTASRDGLKLDADRALESFCQEISVDTESALRSRLVNRSSWIVFNGMRIAKPQRKPSLVAREKVPYTSDQQLILSRSSEHDATQVERVASRMSLPHLSDVCIIDECETPEIRRSMPRFDPTNWDIGSVVRHGKGEGRNAWLLLQAWTLACEAAVDALVRAVDGDNEIAWTAGWYFGTADGSMTLAVHKEVALGHVLALCPVDERGRQAYSTSRRDHMLKLIAIARHEAAHIVFRWHSEDYARLLTKIDGLMDDGKILARILARQK